MARAPLELMAVILAFAVALTAMVVMLLVVYRMLYKEVPEGYAGIIRSALQQSTTVYAAGSNALVLPWEKLVLHDVREKHLDLVIPCVTKDRIRVTIGVSLRWQIDQWQLPRYLSLGIEGPKILQRLVATRLACDVADRALDLVQHDLRLLAFHLEHHVGQHPYGATMYGMIVQEPMITALTLPDELTVTAEKTRQLKMERLIAASRQHIGYRDRVTEAQARAEEILTLGQAVQRVSHRAVEYAETLEKARHPGSTAEDKQNHVP
jgi:hypothetical protein